MVEHVKQAFGKVFSFGLVLLFVALGIIGIVLPILPGLIFLMIAALIAARHIPFLAFMLERNRYSRRALHVSNSFMDLDWWDKTKLCFWGTTRITIDGVQWGLELLGRVYRSLKSQVANHK